MNMIHRLINRLKNAGFRRIDCFIFAVVFGYIVLMVHELSKGLTLERGLLFSILSYYIGYIFYEFTLNRAHVPTVNTDYVLTKKMVDVIRDDYSQKRSLSYHVTDCGSGAGRLTRMIAKNLPSAHVTGLEFSLWPYYQSLVLKRILRIQNLEYRKMDFFAYDYTHCDAVVMFLNARMSERLGEVLYKALKPGAIVIANEFELKGYWPAPQAVTLYSPFKGHLYIYRR